MEQGLKDFQFIFEQSTIEQLHEEYKKQDPSFIEKALVHIKLLLKPKDHIEGKDLEILEKMLPTFKIYPSDEITNLGSDSLISFGYDDIRKKIVLEISDNFLNNLENDEYLIPIIECLKELYMHEELHSQQNKKLIKAPYKNLKIDKSKENIKKYLTYYKEIDAYASQTAYYLKYKINNLTLEEKFDKLKTVDGLQELDNLMGNRKFINTYIKFKNNFDEKIWRRFIKRVYEFMIRN